jgi:hypothetical protein
VVDDPILILEKELVAAARRRGRARRTIGLGAVATAAAALLAVVVAAGALVLLSARAHPAHTTAIPSERQQLIGMLGVLRRPQKRSDLVLLRQASIVKAPGLAISGGTLELESARLAAVTPWGTRVLLALVTPAPASLQAALHRQYPKLPAQRRTTGGLVVESDHGTSCCATPAEVRAGQVISLQGGGPGLAAGLLRTRVYVVVPDGVARVAFHYPAWAETARRPRFRHGETVTVPVHGNLAAARLRHPCCLLPAMTWYAADGAVLKRVSGLAASRRLAQSLSVLTQAAKADPAAPNPVSVRPRVGSRDSSFTIGFRVLIGGAPYAYRLAGPSNCSLARAGLIQGGGPSDVAGREFSAPIKLPAGQRWCPGSYRISVSLYKPTRAGTNVRRPAAPFGTATFRVRP